MYQIKKADKIIFKVSSAIILLLSIADTYFLLKYEHFSQLLWFCNAALFLLAYGLFFRKSIVITGIFLGAIAVQLPWVLDFFAKLLFGHYLFGVSSYMFDYSFNSLRFYVEMDHLLIIPLSAYGVVKSGFNKRGWIFVAIFAVILNGAAYIFSLENDNVNCVFYSCFNENIRLKGSGYLYTVIWTTLLIFAVYLVNIIVFRIIRKKVKVI